MNNTVLSVLIMSIQFLDSFDGDIRMGLIFSKPNSALGDGFAGYQGRGRTRTFNSNFKPETLSTILL